MPTEKLVLMTLSGAFLHGVAYFFWRFCLDGEMEL
jgi:hypothetical protein